MISFRDWPDAWPAAARFRGGKGGCYEEPILPIGVTFRNIALRRVAWRRPVSGTPLGWQSGYRVVTNKAHGIDK